MLIIRDGAQFARQPSLQSGHVNCNQLAHAAPTSLTLATGFSLEISCTQHYKESMEGERGENGERDRLYLKRRLNNGIDTVLSFQIKKKNCFSP